MIGPSGADKQIVVRVICLRRTCVTARAEGFLVYGLSFHLTTMCTLERDGVPTVPFLFRSTIHS